MISRLALSSSSGCRTSKYRPDHQATRKRQTHDPGYRPSDRSTQHKTTAALGALGVAFAVVLKMPPVRASPLLLVGSHFRQRAGAQNRIALGLSHATDRMYLSYSGGCHETTRCRDRLDHIRRRISTENPRHTLRRLERRPAFHRKPPPVLSILTEMLELVVRVVQPASKRSLRNALVGVWHRRLLGTGRDAMPEAMPSVDELSAHRAAPNYSHQTAQAEAESPR